MPSSILANKSETLRKRYIKMEVTSSNTGSLKKPSWSSVVNGVEVFDNGKIVVMNKRGDWWELE